MIFCSKKKGKGFNVLKGSWYILDFLFNIFLLFINFVFMGGKRFWESKVFCLRIIDYLICGISFWIRG